MMSGNNSADMSGVEGFKKALEADFLRQVAELKKDSDNFISEQMFLARRDTERKVHSIRVKHRKEYELLLEREKRRALLEVREEAMSRINSYLDDLSEKVCREIVNLRKDSTRYPFVMEALVHEALEALGEAAVVIVAMGEGLLVPVDPKVDLIEESDPGPEWGGCVVLDSRTRSVIVNNSIKARWDLFQKVFLKEFSEIYGDVLEGFNRFSRELRIP